MATTKSTPKKPVTSTAPVLDAAYRFVDRFANTASMQADTLRIEALGMSRMSRGNDPILNHSILMMQRRIDEAAAFLEQLDEHLFSLKDSLDLHDKKAKAKKKR